MHIAVTKPLFAWDCLEDNPSLATVKKFLESVPDAKLLDGLRRHRGRGRNDCPVHVAWGVVLLRIALRHTSFVATLAELREMTPSVGSSASKRPADVPGSWNISRFLDVLGQEPHASELRRMFDAMIQRLGTAVPDLGRHTAGDSTALHARCKGGEKAVQAEIAQGLPQPSGARKEYTDDNGKVTKVLEWFGYKLHLLVDAKHEVVLAYRVTTANAADCKSLPDLVEEGQANLPAGRIETLAYDKAADDNESHRLLNKAKIRPVIQNRHLWRDQTEQMLPGHNGTSNVVYDEAGTVHCYDRTSQPIGTAPDGVHRLRTPAGDVEVSLSGAARGLDVPARRRVQRGQVLRQDGAREPHHRLAAVPAHPAGNQKVRAAVQWPHVGRAGQRPLKIFWGVDDGNITGSRRFHAMVGAVLIVHAAFATLLAGTPRREGTLGKLRLSPVQKALRETPVAV